MAWFSKTKKLNASQPNRGAPVPAKKGEGVWQKCDGCGEVIFTQDWERNWRVCPLCGHHEPLPVRRQFLCVRQGQIVKAWCRTAVKHRPGGGQHGSGPARGGRRSG